MTITAKNYAAQAERALRDAALEHAKRMPFDSKVLSGIAKGIGAAQHFALPDAGILFNDRLRGLERQALRLPYPKITVEYFMPPTDLPADTPVYAPKRVALAEELRWDVLRGLMRKLVRPESWNEEYAKRFPDDALLIMVTSVFISAGVWFPAPLAWIIPSVDWKGGPDLEERSYTFGDTWATERVNIAGFAWPLLPETMEIIGADPSDDRTFQALVHDVAQEVRGVLELCEALTCSNVRADPLERIDAAKNARRVRDGKLPLYETKVLTIDVAGGKPGVHGHAHGDRASPRQHLRRGHIRRLESRNVWVNAAVVGSAGAGRIDKAYNVEARA